MTAPAPHPPQEPLKVLHIEDRPGDAELVRLALARSRVYRFEVTRVTGLDEAIACAVQAPYDVVLWGLADATPVDVARLRAACPGLPLIALSDHGDEEIEQATLGRGAQEFVSKHELPRRNLGGVVQRSIARFEAEQEFRRLERRLRASRKREQLGRISSDIAHDLNDSLVTILGNAERAMLDLPAESEPRIYLEEIAAAAQKAVRLTRQLAARTEPCGIEPELVHVSRLISDLPGSLRTAVNWSPEVVHERGDELQRGAWLYADPHRMREALLNVLVNAAESLRSPEGTITVRTSLEWTSRASLRGGYNAEELPEGVYVVLEVRDDGAGIGPDALPHIFDPTFSTKHHRRGLGLASTLGIVRRHRGSIRVTSNPGQGTVVRILLPCASAMRPALAKVRRAAPQPAAILRRRPRHSTT